MANNEINILSPGKTVLFNSPLEKDLVRTGTITEGSCFFHSICTGYSVYRKISNDRKENYVLKLRKQLSETITKEEWEKSGSSQISLVPTQTLIRNYFEEIYMVIEQFVTDPSIYCEFDEKATKDIIEKTLLKDCIETYSLIIEICPWDDLNVFLDQAILKCDDSERENQNFNLEICKKLIIDSIVNSFNMSINKDEFQDVEKDKKIFFKEKFRELSTEVVNQAENDAYKNFKEDLSNCRIWVDQFLIENISDYFDKNIYIIDSETRMPYLLGGCENFNKGRKSMILLWINEKGVGFHYESIGRKKNGSIIQRIFTNDDPLIQKIYTILCEPFELENKFPEILQYLPLNIKIQLGIEGGGEEEEGEEEGEEEEEGKCKEGMEISKYQDKEKRKYPPFHAKDCPEKTMKGNDGNFYNSKLDKKGNYFWKIKK